MFHHGWSDEFFTGKNPVLIVAVATMSMESQRLLSHGKHKIPILGALWNFIGDCNE